VCNANGKNIKFETLKYVVQYTECVKNLLRLTPTLPYPNCLYFHPSTIPTTPLSVYGSATVSNSVMDNHFYTTIGVGLIELMGVRNLAELLGNQLHIRNILTCVRDRPQHASLLGFSFNLTRLFLKRWKRNLTRLEKPSHPSIQ
jgi:hypothetical protein